MFSYLLSNLLFLLTNNISKSFMFISSLLNEPVIIISSISFFSFYFNNFFKSLNIYLYLILRSFVIS